jgi:hypothetical protein
MAISARSPSHETVAVAAGTSRRLNIVLSETAQSDLSELALRNRKSMPELVRTALGLLRIVLAENEKGNRLVIVDAEGNPKREIILPE